MTEQGRFKLHYRKYFDIALALSFVLHLVAFAVMPNLKIQALKSETEEIEVIDIPPEIEIPPPPKEISRPKIPVETLDEDVEEEDTIEDTTLDLENLPDAPPPPPPSGGDWLSFDKPPKIRRIVFDQDRDYPVMARTSMRLISGKATRIASPTIITMTKGKLPRKTVSRGTSVTPWTT